MSNDAAMRLWFGTVSLREVPASASPALQELWRAGGLTETERRVLGATLRLEDDSERRRSLIRATRHLIRQAGYNVDLLSTPAAPMRGL